MFVRNRLAYVTNQLFDYFDLNAQLLRLVVAEIGPVSIIRCHPKAKIIRPLRWRFAKR